MKRIKQVGRTNHFSARRKNGFNHLRNNMIWMKRYKKGIKYIRLKANGSYVHS